MPNYRRAIIPGGTFFFTVNLLERSQSLLTDHIDLLRQVFANAQQRRPFTIDAAIILPDHLHCIWTIPPNDANFSTRWHDIKSRFPAGIPKGEHLSTRRRKKGERGIWQRRFWEHTIRDQKDLQNHMDYIHYNPVKHGHVDRVGDWPFSSFHKFVQMGVYPVDWVAQEEVKNLKMETPLRCYAFPPYPSALPQGGSAKYSSGPVTRIPS